MTDKIMSDNESIKVNEENSKRHGSRVWLRTKDGVVLEKDKRFYKEKPDPGFSPEHNRAVVERTINKAVMERLKKHEQYMGDVKERVEAAASFLTSPHGAQSSRSPEQYFGNKRLAQLQGQKIVQKLKKLKEAQDGRPVFAAELGYIDNA